jgi:hypothetical protein
MWPVSLAENKALAWRYYDEVLTGRQHQLLDELLAPGFVATFLADLRSASRSMPRQWRLLMPRSPTWW